MNPDAIESRDETAFLALSKSARPSQNTEQERKRAGLAAVLQLLKLIYEFHAN